MTGSYCSLQEILIMSYLPDSCKVRSGPGVSAQPPAKKTAGLIEKETEVSYDLYGIRLRAPAVVTTRVGLWLGRQGVCMRFSLILFVLVLVLVLEIRIL